MTYEIHLKILIKTMGQKLSHKQMKKLILDKLWEIPEFRDVNIYDYEGDTEKEPNTFSNIRQEFLVVSSTALDLPQSLP